MKTIVSLTPIAVERDSRTFKQAASMARLGHRAIVVEGESSVNLNGELPFELISVRARAEPASASKAGAGAQPQAGVPVAPSAAPPPPLTVADRVAARAPASVRRVFGPSWRVVRRGWVRVLRSPAIMEPVRLVTYLSHYIRTCRSVASSLPDADLYYLHSHVQLPALLLRGGSGRFIYDAHDLYWTLRQDGRRVSSSERCVWFVHDVVERLAARRARACVTVGQDVAKHAEERFGRRFVVVRNAHDSRLDDQDTPDLRARLELDAGVFLLAVSGNFKLGMAVKPMLRAMTMLPKHVHLALVGRYHEQFAALAETLGVADRVHVLPPVAPTHIVPVLARADLAPILYYPSSPSVRRALPNGFFHAVAAGVPVLYPRHLRELRELAERYELGWEIDPESYSSIAVTVRRLLDTPEMLAERRRHVREVRDDLSWAREEVELARVVGAALDRGKVA